MKSGVYQITNRIDGRKYIGSAQNFSARWAKHSYDLRNGKHHSKFMQRCFDKYGEDAFAFEVLLYCDKENVLMYEQILLDAVRPEYNMHKSAFSSMGRVTSQETKLKLKAAITGKTRSNETRKRMSEAWKHRNPVPPISEETRKKMSDSQKGGKKIRTAEHQAKISAAKRKLSDQNIRDVKAMLSAGFSQSQIARDFNVSAALICNIASGKKYSEVL